MLSYRATLLSPLRGCELGGCVFLGLSPKAIGCHRFAVQEAEPNAVNGDISRACRSNSHVFFICTAASFVPNNIGRESAVETRGLLTDH